MSYRLFLFCVCCSEPMKSTMVFAKNARAAERLFRLARGCEGAVKATRWPRVQKKHLRSEFPAVFAEPAQLRGWFR